KAFLGRVTSAAWKALRRADLGDPVRLANDLGPAAQQRHLQVWLAHAAEQRVIHDLRLDGGVPDAVGDTLFATMQNALGTKLDLYASREMTYDITVAPLDSGHAQVSGRLSYVISNNAPANLPSFVETPADRAYEIGELRSFVSIYSPLDLRS